MSTRTRGPKYQNSFAFKHNPKSKKTKKILGLRNEGLCRRCMDQIEWRKKYRKYKPLTQAGTCNKCHQKAVTSAYHTICTPCANAAEVCAKCGKTEDIIESEEQMAVKEAELDEAFEASLEGLREREKRTVLRKLEKKETKKDEDENDIDDMEDMEMDDNME